MTDSTKDTPVPASLREELGSHATGADLERVWQLLSALDAHDRADTTASSDALWGRIAAATRLDGSSRTTMRSTSPLALSPVTARPVGLKPPRRSTAVRAGWQWRLGGQALAAAAGMTLMLWWGTGNVRFSSPAGQTHTVVLRDGSTVALNGASELEYPRFFRPAWLGGDGRRSVALRGEAYFRVAKGNAPFVVHTAQADIQVVGTRFNVRAREMRAADAQTTARTDVAVEEGIVRVRARAAGAALDGGVVLRANEQVRVGNLSGPGGGAALRVTIGDSRRELAWTSGGFAAVEQPLREVLHSLEAQYGVELTMLDSVAAAAPITLYYPERTTIDRIINDLATARGWTLRRSSRGYELHVVR